MEGMIDTEISALAAVQDDAVAVWQLVRRGWTEDQVKARTAGFQRVFDGVFLLTASPPTQRQRHRAATLTTPTSVLSHASAGGHAGFRPLPDGMEFVVVARPGDGGPQRFGDLLATHSTVLFPDVVEIRDGLPTTTPERTLLDLGGSRGLAQDDLRRAMREAIRMNLVTCTSLLRMCDRHEGRRGTARVRTLATRYDRLGLGRAKSPAEALAMELIDGWRLPLPLLTVDVAGEEADLVYPETASLIEIHGPQWHRLKDRDAEKVLTWRRAGYSVGEIVSDDVFLRPDLLRHAVLAALGRT